MIRRFIHSVTKATSGSTECRVFDPAVTTATSTAGSAATSAVSGAATSAAGSAARPAVSRRTVSYEENPLPTASQPTATTFHLTTMQRQPAGRLLTTLAVFSIRYMLPGIAMGSGGSLERTMGFELLHDAAEDVFMVHVQTTNSFLQLHNVWDSSIKDLVSTFFRNKPLTSRVDLDQRISALVHGNQFIRCDVMAY
jgi:hypothetical protein